MPRSPNGFRAGAALWRWRHTAVLAAGTLAFAAVHAQTASSADAAKLLIDQGNYWQAHQRGDLALQAWQKVLALNPNQPDALYGMGVVEADRGQTTRAQDYLDRLRKVAPDFPNISTLASRLGQPTKQDVTLNAARQLAQQGQANQAAERYREAAGGKAMTPQVALEYYQTLGGTAEGWDEARRGLERLARENPDNPQIRLALAQHLTYREGSRREGIRQLQPLASNANVGTAAKTSWRQALIWLGARPADSGLFQTYLNAVPDDAAVKAKLDAMQQQATAGRAAAATNAVANARGQAVAAGFAALNKGDLSTATARFTRVLADHPGDYDALGGMGVIRLRQEKFADAQQYLERASRGPNPGRWRDSLRSASYWTLVANARAAQQTGDAARAREWLERAIRTDPNEVTAHNALGDTLLAGGDPRGAEAAYRDALAHQADNPDAIRGVVAALTRQGRNDEALQFAGRLTVQQQQRIGGLGAIRAQQQQAVARAAEQRGDLATARTNLESALVNDPGSPWIRLDLARVYNKQGELGKARSVVDGLVASNPSMPDALYAAALLYGELQDWDRVLILLQHISPQSRTADMTTLQRRAWVHANVAHANALSAQGQVPAAHALLQQVEPVAGNNSELAGAVADGYSRARDNDRALGLMRRLLAQSTQPDPALQMQYAGILLNTHQDAELADVLGRLQGARLTDDQQVTLGRLQSALAIRQADDLRLRGNLAAAYEALAPSISVNPSDVDLQAALARLYAAAGEYDQALNLYTVARKARPNDLDLTLALATTAAQAQKYSIAEDAAEAAVKQAPNNSRVLAAVGRIYRSEGKNNKAAGYFRQAIALENGTANANGRNGPLAAAVPGGPPNGANRMPNNPFVGKKVVNAGTSGTGAMTAGAAGGSLLPNAGQYDGTGGPPSNPLPMTAGNFPYATQAYPSQRDPSTSPSRTMPYLPPNSPPSSLPAAPAYYQQQMPAAYPSSSNRAMGPSSNRGAGDMDVRSSAGGSVSGSSDSGGGRDYAGSAGYDGQGIGQSSNAPSAAYYAPPAPQGYPQTNNGYASNYSAPPPVVVPATPPLWPQDPSANVPASVEATSAANDASDCDSSSGDDGGTRSEAGGSAMARREIEACRPMSTPRRRAPRRVAPVAKQSPALVEPRYAATTYPQSYAPVAAVPQQYGVPAQQAYAPVGQNPTTPMAANGAPPSADSPLTLQQELAQLDQQTTSTVSGGLSIHNRNGESGLSSLTDIEAPIEGRVRAGDGHVVVQVTPVTLDSGTLDGRYPTSSRFGGGPVAAANQVNGNVAAVSGQHASGVGLAVGYQTDHVSADVGTTPVGFKETNVVGGLSYKGAVNDQVTYTIAASRRAVTDSLLSYAGVTDSRTGQTWGGVTSSGARFDLTYDDGTNGVYGYGSYGYLQGHNVESNTRGEGGGGFYTRLLKESDRVLSAGLNLDVLGYDKNLSYFTYGQGGYFSPQTYVSLSVPVSWSARNGKFVYQVKGALGIQYFRENDSPYFPTNAGLQSAAVQAQQQQAAAGQSTTGSATYAGQSKTGLGYNLSANAEYQLTSNLFVGALAGVDNARDYRQWYGTVYLRYAFERMTGAMTMPPVPLRSVYLAN